MDDLYKYPRLYVEAPLAPGDMPLCEAHAHYLRTVLRRSEGETVRLFNGRDGEWLGTLALSGRRDAAARVHARARAQPVRVRRVHLFFAPIKKDRLETLVETAVQLDATDLHPVLTDRTEVREIKQDKMRAHIIEAAEQCERLDLPALHPLAKLDRLVAGWVACPVFAGLEREEAKPLCDALVPEGDCAALVGPVGGWTEGERAYLKAAGNVVPVTLGSNVLRCETAVAAMLARLAASSSL